jgi:hypothetical protein
MYSLTMYLWLRPQVCGQRILLGLLRTEVFALIKNAFALILTRECGQLFIFPDLMPSVNTQGGCLCLHDCRVDTYARMCLHRPAGAMFAMS